MEEEAEDDLDVGPGKMICWKCSTPIWRRSTNATLNIIELRLREERLTRADWLSFLKYSWRVQAHHGSEDDFTCLEIPSNVNVRQTRLEETSLIFLRTDFTYLLFKIII